jgi:hypothetical protein
MVKWSIWVKGQFGVSGQLRVKMSIWKGQFGVKGQFGFKGKFGAKGQLRVNRSIWGKVNLGSKVN